MINFESKTFLRSLILGSLFFAGALFVDSAHASSFNSLENNKQYSLGGFYGGFIGASASYNLKSKTFIDAAFAMDMSGAKNYHAWADYLFRMPQLFRLMNNSVTWYYGGGVKFRTENDLAVEEIYFLGPRATAGLHTQISNMPLEVYTEVALSLYVVESSSTEFDFALGARYYF